jgi:hypothetical protein
MSLLFSRRYLRSLSDVKVVIVRFLVLCLRIVDTWGRFRNITVFQVDGAVVSCQWRFCDTRGYKVVALMILSFYFGGKINRAVTILVFIRRWRGFQSNGLLRFVKTVNIYAKLGKLYGVDLALGPHHIKSLDNFFFILIGISTHVDAQVVYFFLFTLKSLRAFGITLDLLFDLLLLVSVSFGHSFYSFELFFTLHCRLLFFQQLLPCSFSLGHFKFLFGLTAN